MNRVNKGIIEEILSQKEAKQGLHVKDIAAHLYNRFYNNLFNESESVAIEAVVKRVNSILGTESKKPAGLFSKANNPKTGKPGKGLYKLRKSSPRPSNPEPPADPPIVPEDENPKPQPQNLFTGKAGECAVMAELLFRGYNVNNMLVDDGVDIVASKNNMFYYLQVKTTTIDDKKRIHATIRQKKFNDYIGLQIRYVIVARCLLNKIETNIYFIFSNSDIQRLIFGKCINANQDRINIKIEIDPKDGRPYIYDEKKVDVEFFMNRFEL